VIEKKLTMVEEYNLKIKYPRAISQFYSAYNLALAVLGEKDKEEDISIRNRLWRKLLLTKGKQRKKINKRLKDFIRKDMPVIIRALNIIEGGIDSDDYSRFDYIDQSDAVLMMAYEYPD